MRFDVLWFLVFIFQTIDTMAWNFYGNNAFVETMRKQIHR